MLLNLKGPNKFGSARDFDIFSAKTRKISPKSIMRSDTRHDMKMISTSDGYYNDYKVIISPSQVLEACSTSFKKNRIKLDFFKFLK